MRRIKGLTLLVLIIILSGIFMRNGSAQVNSVKARRTYEGFENPFPGFQKRGFRDLLRWSVWERLSGKKQALPESYSFETVKNDGAYLRENTSDFNVTWVGHSTLIIQIDGKTILTDPIWSDRASPVQFAGPKRHVPPGIALKDLPHIDVVLISHDHYDHLDQNTIEFLGNDPLYLVPLKVGEIIESWGITNYEEFDWWDSITFNQVEFICTPAQHFSGRNPLAQNNTLWASWVVRSGEISCYYGGDSGYFPDYAEIGEKYGPFDLAALPIGAYKPRWFMAPVHMSPIEAVDAFLDLKAEMFVPIHWGTFELADEPLDEPPQFLRDEIKRRELDENDFIILKHGETRILKQIEAAAKKSVSALP
jgi:L-ascorbate metabolism protein UlaG (beta-lactamase superfamily)